MDKLHQCVGDGQTDELEMLRREVEDLRRQVTASAASPSTRIPYEELDVRDSVGGGGHSIVYRGFWMGCPVAIKKWFDPDTHSDDLLAQFWSEFIILSSLRHTGVVQFLGACSKPPHLCMVMEYLPHSLFNVLHASSVALDQKRVVGMAIDIAAAFRYLHSRKPAIIHRDIKPANFLLDRSWTVKVCDFGLAANTREDVKAGTPAYMAPELLLGRPFNEKVDVYSFGITLNEMVSRRLPFEGLGRGEIQERVVSGERPEVSCSCNGKLSDVIVSCWQAVPANRPGFREVYEALKAVQKAL